MFTFASLLCAIAPSPAALIAFRVIQALGAAFLVPASLALVLNAFDADRRSHGVALLSAVGAAAAGLGPSLGGVLVAAGGWRLVFPVNLPIGISAVVLGRRHLVESRTPGRRRTPDLLGALLFAAAVGLLVLGVVKGQEWGWGSARIVAAFAAAALLGAAFVWRCSWHRSPMIDLSLLRMRTFTAANGMTIIGAAGFYGYTLTNVLFMTGAVKVAVLGGAEVAPPAEGVEPATVSGPPLDRAESANDLIVLAAGGAFFGRLWTEFCLQQADRILTLTAGGEVPPSLGDRTELRGCDLVAYDVAPGSGLLDGWAPVLDLRSGRLMISRYGPLSEVVGFSICLPILAPPQIRDRELFVDGSLVNNLPIEPVANLGEACDRCRRQGDLQAACGGARDGSGQRRRRRQSQAQRRSSGTPAEPRRDAHPGAAAR